ncbi:SEC-C metal-binding domain-containing protein [Acetivibrio cellulolyticus]|uniref:SEC-C metal-binding domain-containing protein n=1 Tax=Acetivibrio cellulolyticus TaxID=35830 RepID=UPI0001E2D446|nr:SEC-C metal-binding domain-containing protein [Acetivibrio cellulolyticus]
MSLFDQWKEVADKERPEKEYNEFWNTYLEKEKEVYAYILENHNEIISGKVSELAQKFEMDSATFAGFMDGINTSLVKEVDLDSLSEDFDIRLEVDYEKLFYNMLDAKANWLYTLPQWDGVLTKDRRNEITKDYNRSNMAVSNKVGRNEPCPCGSGKKYKKCCGI